MDSNTLSAEVTTSADTPTKVTAAQEAACWLSDALTDSLGEVAAQIRQQREELMGLACLVRDLHEDELHEDEHGEGAGPNWPGRGRAVRVLARAGYAVGCWVAGLWVLVPAMPTNGARVVAVLLVSAAMSWTVEAARDAGAVLRGGVAVVSQEVASRRPVAPAREVDQDQDGRTR